MVFYERKHPLISNKRYGQFRAALALGCLVFPLIAPAASKDIPAHGPAIVLFNGHDLSGFDTFLKSKGLNNDPDHVFKIENGVIHVSGTEMGYIITKQDFQNYYLKAEFKWGEGTFAPREGQARDSGILYNVQGDQKVWPRSIEFQNLKLFVRDLDCQKMAKRARRIHISSHWKDWAAKHSFGSTFELSIDLAGL